MTQGTRDLGRLKLTRTSEIITAYRAVNRCCDPDGQLSARLCQAIKERDWDGSVTPLFTGEESALLITALHAMQSGEANTPGEQWEQASAAHILVQHKPLEGTDIYRLAMTLSHCAMDGA